MPPRTWKRSRAGRRRPRRPRSRIESGSAPRCCRPSRPGWRGRETRRARRPESAPARETEELLLVEQGDPVPLLTQALDLHELHARVLSGHLERVRLSAHHYRRAHRRSVVYHGARPARGLLGLAAADAQDAGEGQVDALEGDRKSTRLNSSHSQISYAVFCLKKKKT